tara:strand:- start:541 stop:669 length:129 start_codon:yes stop_codon:yes gene_type:complete
VNERIDRVKANLTDAPQLAEVLRHHEQARSFWREKIRNTNAD